MSSGREVSISQDLGGISSALIFIANPRGISITLPASSRNNLIYFDPRFDSDNSTGKGEEELSKQFSRFQELPAEVRQKIWMMSIDPITLFSDISAYQGTVSNAVTLRKYGGPIEREQRTLWLGTRQHYELIRLFQINKETRHLAFMHWGSPRPLSADESAPYLFNPHRDTLGVHLDNWARAIQETDSSSAWYETYVRDPDFRVWHEAIAPAPIFLLSRIHRIELQLDRVEDMRTNGYDWTSSGARNPLTFLFHFPNLRHLVFAFRRPQLSEIPEEGGRTVVCGNHVVPITEAVQSHDYYHLETIQCLHSFLGLFRHPSTRDRARATFRNIRTIGITVNLKPALQEIYWFPYGPTTRVAMVPKGMSPLDCVDDNSLQEASRPPVSPSPAPPLAHFSHVQSWDDWVQDITVAPAAAQLAEIFAINPQQPPLELNQSGGDASSTAVAVDGSAMSGSFAHPMFGMSYLD